MFIKFNCTYMSLAGAVIRRQSDGNWRIKFVGGKIVFLNAVTDSLIINKLENYLKENSL